MTPKATGRNAIEGADEGVTVAILCSGDWGFRLDD